MFLPSHGTPFLVFFAEIIKNISVFACSEALDSDQKPPAPKGRTTTIPQSPLREELKENPGSSA